MAKKKTHFTSLSSLQRPVALLMETESGFNLSAFISALGSKRRRHKEVKKRSSGRRKEELFVKIEFKMT